MLASGGAIVAAIGGASLSASGDPCKRVLAKVWTLVRAVREAIAARPFLHCPLTKGAVSNLTEAVEKEFRTKRRWQEANADGSVNRHGQTQKKQRRQGFNKTDLRIAKQKVRRRENGDRRPEGAAS